MTPSPNLEEWLSNQLSVLLGFDATEEIAGYVVSMSSITDQEEYLREILNSSNMNHANFIKKFIEKSSSSMVEVKNTVMRNKEVDSTAHKKEVEITNNRANNKQKRLGYVPLYTGNSVLLPGRHECICQAARHSLINNCLGCGRVVCSQEGSGPCFFCGELVCTSKEMKILQGGSKKAEALRQKLNSVASCAHKDKLLEFDRTSAARTKVIDDESDYFSSAVNDSWISPSQREALRKKQLEKEEKKAAAKRSIKVNFDFAGRRIIEDIEHDVAEDDIPIQSLNTSDFDDVSQDFSCMNKDRPRPLFMEEYVNMNRGKLKLSDQRKEILSRVQDDGIQSICDYGFCLTVHQPMAGLLVAGIKLHEGRTWYSKHRGCLWIHAASTPPHVHEIEENESFYKHLYGEENLVLPSSYPTNCVLGCVDVSDVLPQEEYREQFPHGTLTSPFVFICTNPKELSVKFPMSGSNKIYKLDSKIHKTIRKISIRKLA